MKKTGPETVLGFLLMAYPAGAFFLYIFYHSLLLSLVGGLLVVFFVPVFEDHLARRRQEVLAEQFRDMLFFLSSAIATGRTMTGALEEAEKGVLGIYGPKAPIYEELSAINRKIRDHRAKTDDALMEFAEQSGVEDIRSFAEIYSLCMELGGDVEEIIGTTTTVITDKMSVMREIRTLTAQKVFEGRLIAAMPVVIMAGLSLFYPDYVEVFYTTPAGRLLMTLALAGIIAGYLMLRKMTRIEL